jgi:hypothetical protein
MAAWTEVVSLCKTPLMNYREDTSIFFLDIEDLVYIGFFYGLSYAHDFHDQVRAVQLV